jgi:hypothetical protein
MSDNWAHEKVLLENRDVLVAKIKLDEGLWNCMLKNGIVNQETKQTIEVRQKAIPSTH